MPGITPSTPQQKEQAGFTQDGMSPAGSSAQASHAGGSNTKEEKEEK